MEFSVFMLQVAVLLTMVTGWLMFWDISRRQGMSSPPTRPSFAPVLNRVRNGQRLPVIISGQIISANLIRIDGQNILLEAPVPSRLAGRRVSLVLEPPLA